MNKPEVNSEQYQEWCKAQLIEYFSKAVTDDVTDDQAEAIEYLEAQRIMDQKKQ